MRASREKQIYLADDVSVIRETAPDYAKWRRRLFFMNMYIAIAVLLLEVGVSIILIAQDMVEVPLPEYLFFYLFLPSGLNFSAVLVDWLLTKKFPHKDWLLNYSMVLTIVFMCTVVSATHYVFSITLTVFLIPLLFSVVFGSKRFSDITAIICCVCVVLTVIWRDMNGNESSKQFVIQEMVIALGMIGLSLAAARTLISLMDEQNHRLINALTEEKRSQEEALAANRAKSSFLANMSHEIRTPINAILGMNEMILREARDPGIREYAGNIQSSGNSLLAIVSDVLDISKIESGKTEIIHGEYEVNSLVSDCCNMIAERARLKGLELIVETIGSIPARLSGDEVHIRQIVLNLLTNSVKYTERGTVKLTVSGEPKDGKYMLRISVRDTGIGISEENMGKLFEQFRRFDMKRNRTIEGTGLGLSIVKLLCTLMNATVTAQSTVGVGSEFVVVIPQDISDDTLCAGLNLNYSSGEYYEYSPSFEAPDAVILAVDDLPVNLLVIVSMLRRTRITVDTAGSGQECLEMAAEKKYDLILMDHMMPEMDGIETFHRLRSIPLNCDAPVIMLTANALAGMREMYIGEGFADYISKPVRGEKLEEVIRRCLPQQLVRPAEEHGADEVPAIYPEFEELTRTLPQLNLQIAMPYCCASTELYGQVLRDYAESSRYEEMQQAFSQRRMEDYRRCVHSLKSTSLTIGLEGLSERARASETALKSGFDGFAEMEYEELMSEYGDALDKIRSFLRMDK